MKQIIDCVRGYNSHGDLKRARTMLQKHGYEHFVEFRDVQSEHALQYMKIPPEIIDERLKVGDVILILKRSKDTGARTFAAKDWIRDGIYYEQNYWVVGSVTQAKDDRYFHVTAHPDTTRGPYHCGFGSMSLPKDGKQLKEWDCVWHLIYRPPQPMRP